MPPENEPAPGTALGTEPKWEDSVPEKFREGGKKDGAINHGAIYKSYTELESAMGKVGKPPAKADDYKFELKDNHLLTPEALGALRTKAHGAGYTQAQFELLANEGLGLLDAASKELVADLLGTQETAEKALAEKWPDAKERDTNRKAARRAFDAYFGGDKELLKVIGNIPGVIVGLAKLGAEIKEDAPPGGAEAANESAESLDKEIATEMANPAYTNPFHKDHLAQKAKVDALFLKRYGNKPVTGLVAGGAG